MPTSTDWSSRPVPTAMSPERLSALVDESVARADGMLFTATPTAELDAIGCWQRLMDLAFAGQMREIVAAYNRAEAEHRDFAADEVGLAIGATTTTGGNLLAQALGLAALPGLLEAVETGQLTQRHVLAVLRELDRVELTVEQRHAVVLVAPAKYRGEAPGELGQLVTRLILQVDRAAAAARDAKATVARKVRFCGDVDGQAIVTARGPAAAVAAIRAALEATLPLHPDAGDERTRDAREFDLFVDLLTGGAEPGSWHAEIVVPFTVAQGGDTELAEIPGFGPILPATARDLLEQCDTVAQTAVDQHGHVIAAGTPIRLPKPAPAHDEREPDLPEPEIAEPAVPEPEVAEPAVAEPAVAEPAVPEPEVAGPVAAEPAAAAPSVFFRPPAPSPSPAARLSPDLLDRLAQRPVLEDLTGSAYRFPPRLRRYLEARDRTCVFPGCNRPARRTDKDHPVPWPIGPTSAENGECLCRHHHRAKHKVFRVNRDRYGCYRWTTRGGWVFIRQPKGF
jgi:hypothetical protein